MKRLSLFIAMSLLLSACDGSSSDDNTNSDTDNVENSAPEPEAQTPGSPFVSPATVTTETNFNDTFVSNNTANISWTGPSVSSTTSVDYIAQAFNTARAKDPTVKEKLRMPQQATWDSYTTSEKVIYLINSERSARGLRPFRGIAPELVSSSELYASELSVNGQFSHTYGTYSTTTARLAGWAGVIAPPQTSVPTGNENTTYNTYFIEEMIAYNDTSDSTIYEAEARSIYYFMYLDKSPTIGPAYIHRTTILIQNPIAGLLSGLVTSSNARPVIGANSTEASVNGRKRNTLVIHGIDPNSNWDLSNITAAPGLIGPESASDCLSGTFTESFDGAGNNTSECR